VFALLNTGADMVRSKNRLLTTIAYRLDGEDHAMPLKARSLSPGPQCNGSATG
jgi:glycerol kinase